MWRQNFKPDDLQDFCHLWESRVTFYFRSTPIFTVILTPPGFCFYLLPTAILNSKPAIMGRTMNWVRRTVFEMTFAKYLLVSIKTLLNSQSVGWCWCWSFPLQKVERLIFLTITICESSSLMCELDKKKWKLKHAKKTMFPGMNILMYSGTRWSPQTGNIVIFSVLLHVSRAITVPNFK